MTVSIQVYSDYVCPFCYLVEPMLSDVAEARGAEIDWRAFELRPDPVPTLKPEAPYLPAIWERAVYPQAKEIGIAIRLPSISPQPRSRKAFEILAHARRKGLAHDWSMAVFKAFFEEDRDIGDEEVLADIAASVGLDPDDVKRVLKDGVYAEEHEAALSEAHEAAVNVVPTVVVGETVFRGSPTRKALEAAVDRERSRRSEAAA